METVVWLLSISCMYENSSTAIKKTKINGKEWMCSNYSMLSAALKIFCLVFTVA
jgi:hypothetical protein